MQKNNCKIQSILIFLIILNVIVLILTVALSNLTYAQENIMLHQKTLDEITTHAPSENPHIAVGKSPRAIAVNEDTNTVYVANRDDGTISVIDGSNNTKVGEDIKVGKGISDITINKDTNTVYVANSYNGTIYVINRVNNYKTKIGEDIKVGERSFDNSYINELKLATDTYNTVYAANFNDRVITVINGTNNNNTKMPNIKVAGLISDIAVNPYTKYIFVYNSIEGNKYISVIDGSGNKYTKIGEDIKVGDGITDISFNGRTNTMYLANSYNDTISVIVTRNADLTKIADIKVGHNPRAIAVNEDTNTVYVANRDDGTISVINGTAVIRGTNNMKVGDIKVEDAPSAIGINGRTNTVYVANYGDNTVSVIDEIANKVVAKVTLNIEPLNAGHIECDKDQKLKPPIGQQFYIWPGSECIAKPNQGFEFVSWQENLGGNSTQLIKFSPLPSIWDSVLDFLDMKPDKPEAILDITKFGSFTANFKALPPPIPTEYVATLFTVVATAFIGSWLTPTIIGWRKAKKEGRRVHAHHLVIKSLYNDGKVDENDIPSLDELKDDIMEDYAKGNINEHHYNNLNNTISILYEEIYKKKIDSLNGKNSNDIILDKVKDDIKDAYAKGKISEQHYDLLNEKISNSKNNQQSNNNQLASSSRNSMPMSTTQGSPIKT
jgi:YVTN family beta-propeller protein